MMTSDGRIIRKEKYVQFANDVSKDKHVSGTPLAVPSVEGTNTLSQGHQVVTEVLQPGQHDVTVLHKEGNANKGVTSVVRRSVLVPSRLRDRVWGHEHTHLTNLRHKYNVEVFTDAQRGKLHTKGTNNTVLECYAAVTDLMAEWRSREG